MVLATQFAPAERAPERDIRQAADYFATNRHLIPFLDAVPIMYLVLNRYRQIVFANRAVFDAVQGQPEAVYGLRPGEALGCVHALEDPDGGCGTTEFCRTCGAVKAILTSLGGERSTEECRISQARGEALNLRVWATPLELDGERYSIFAVEDISHEKRRYALERIFFHDLMNIAGVMSGFLSAFKDDFLSPTQEHKEVLYQNAQRLIAEINAQRELVAAENSDLKVHPVPIESLDILREIQTAYANHTVAENREIVIDPQSENVTFTSDPTLLGRVLGNMVKNGLEASPPGQAVTLSCYTRKNQVAFEVHNLVTMPRDVQLQVFQRSFSTKSTDRGLGTYSMRLLTERYLGGRITFTSSDEHGTTFCATYPLAWTPVGEK